MDVQRLFPLRCSAQHYHWGVPAQDGEPPLIASLLGETPEDDTPYAELWIGAHPGAPSVVKHPNGTTPLNGFIEEYRSDVLGELVERTYGPRLPFMLKILNCRQPLSIQAHPDREKAARLHEQDPEHFPDSNHKPEIAIAIDSFELLAGFRPVAEIVADIQNRGSLKRFFLGQIDADAARAPGHWLREACGRLFYASERDVADTLEGLALDLTMVDPLSPSDKRFLEALEQYPGDRGAIAAYLLNAVHLDRGQAVFTGPGVPHSYFRGSIVECMASSDNVVRAGLSPKHIDRDALLQVLRYDAAPPNVFDGDKTAEGVQSYTVPAEDFQVDWIQGGAGQRVSLSSGGGVSVMLVLEGRARLSAGEETDDAPRGSAWLWPAALKHMAAEIVEEGTVIIRARPNVKALLDSVEIVDTLEEGQQDFGALFESQQTELKREPQPGEKVTGRITAIDRNSVFVDLGAKSEGVIEIGEFTDSDGTVTVQPGEDVEAYCLSTDQERIRLTCRMTGEAANTALQEAYESGIPVEGKVTGERKGGFSVKVGHQDAFCPYSQMDIGRRDSAVYIGETFTFTVAEFSEGGRNIVVSRRLLLEQQRQALIEELKQTLQPGEIVEGEVRRVMDFGAFVDIGGVEGLIPISEISWSHVDDPREIVQEGNKVQVQIREIDWDRERISLSLRRAGLDPWENIEGRFVVGARYSGRVTRLAPFGAFVELEPGIEGLVHISKLGAGRRINHPSEVLEEGEEVEVAVESVEPERRRMGLSMEQTVDADAGVPVERGNTVTGVVDGIKDYGVFVKLPDGRTGLLHASKMDLPPSGNREKEIAKKYPAGQAVAVVVESVDGDRVSLGVPNEETAAGDMMTDSNGGDLGSLGQLFEGLDM